MDPARHSVPDLVPDREQKPRHPGVYPAVNGHAADNLAPPGPHVFQPAPDDALRAGFHPDGPHPPEPLASERQAHAATRLALTSALAHCEHLEAELLAVQETERERLGRDLHDGVCQILAGVSLRLQCYAREVANGQGTAEEHAAEARHIDCLLREAFTEMRELSHRLVPVIPTPHPENFHTVLRRLAERTATLLDVQCVVRGGKLGTALDATVSAHLSRVVQEAAANARRHGGATRIVIALSRRGERGRLTVKDDGVGIPERRSARAGLGLRTMAYRAAMVGGRLHVRRGGLGGGAGPGTSVNCSFAWPDAGGFHSLTL